MFKQQDPYSFTQYLSLYLDKTPIGILSLEYTVALYNDVLVSTTSFVSQPTNQQFLLTCTQRVLLKNVSNSKMNPDPVSDPSLEQFEDYPALVSSSVEVRGTTEGLTLNLLDYSPQTVNTAVQQSQSLADTSGKATSVTSTTGSSYSQSTTYGTSVSVSAASSGDGSASYARDHSRTTTSTSDKSNSSGSDASVSNEASNSASMSIKDWGSYAVIDPSADCPTWVFGQEYPWNAIECRYAMSGKNNPSNDNQVEMYISSTMQSQLYDGSFLYPPSELSYFGLNFVMKSQWRVYIDYTASTEIIVNSPVDYYSASHALEDAGQPDANGDEIYVPKVYMDSTSRALQALDASGAYVTPSVTIDLNVMGLDPIGKNSDTAIVGFLPNKFIPPVTPPSPASSVKLPADFKIISSTNDLMVLDTGDESGFSVSQTSITADWDAGSQEPYEITLYFKVLDWVDEYTLYIKQWKTSSTGVMLSFVFNGDASNVVTKYVDAYEGEGGEGNLLKLALRDLDFSSIEYHDYLQLGLNSVAIAMTPMSLDGCGYQIRALSVQKS